MQRLLIPARLGLVIAFSPAAVAQDAPPPPIPVGALDRNGDGVIDARELADLDRNGKVEPADMAAFANAWWWASQNPLGACCAAGACTMTVQGACASPATWLGPGTTCAPNPCPQPPPPPPSAGWTDLAPAAGARVIYVSSSTGNDTFPGTIAQPRRTVAAGLSACRSGMPDQVLLKRGDVFTGDVTLGANIGGTASARAVVGAYGTGPRPKIVGSVQRTGSNQSCGNLILAGLDIAAPATGSGEGLVWQGGPDMQPAGGENVLVEDCYIHHWRNNVVLQGMTNLVVRRCVVTDSTTTDPTHAGRSQGFYIGISSGVTLEENVIDANGWPAVSIYNHNVYIQSDCQQPVVFRRNIVVSGAATGVQVRPGGVCEDNVFARNPITITFGAHDGGSQTGTIRGNVILEGRDLDAQNPRGVGISVSHTNSQGVLVENNIIANRLATTEGGGGLEINPASYAFVNAATIRNNVFYNWHNSLLLDGTNHSNVTFSGNQVTHAGSSWPLVAAYAGLGGYSFSANRYYRGGSGGGWFSVSGQARTFAQWQSSAEPTATQGAVNYPNPTRTLASYASSIGLAGTHDAMMAALRARSRDNWPSNLTTEALLAYFRAGFGR